MTLTIQDLGALGEFFGSIAVLATLIYLALQMRQNTMAIAAQLDAAHISATQALMLTASTSTELLEALKEDRADSLTINEWRRGNYWLAQVVTWQWDRQQLRHVPWSGRPDLNRRPSAPKAEAAIRKPLQFQ